MYKKGREVVSRFAVENFLSDSTGTNCWETFGVLETSGDRKILCIEGACHDFMSLFFCLTVSEKSWEPCCVSESLGYRKILCKGGRYHNFLSTICCLTVPKNFLGEPFSVSLYSGMENNRDKRGGRVSRFSVENFLSVSTEKLRRETLLYFRKFLVSKNFRDKRGARKEGVSQFSVENLLSHSTKKFRKGTLPSN